MADRTVLVTDFGRDQLQAVDLGGLFDHTVGQAAAAIDGLVSAAFAGAGIDSVQADAVVNTSDVGAGTVGILAAKLAYLIDANHILQPLDVFVLQDSRFELLPSTRENAEEIPGRHGEIDFGSSLQPRIIELHVANREGFEYANREQVRAALAAMLNPLFGPQAMAFADDLDKTYFVKVKAVGNIDIVRRAQRFFFTIPFRCSNPFAIGTWEKQHTGSGTLSNAGTAETPLIIEIAGPVTNPNITIGGQTLSYTGALIAGDRVVIDTERMTVAFNGVNALHNFSGPFPRLQPGATAVTAATTGTTTWRWRDRWI